MSDAKKDEVLYTIREFEKLAKKYENPSTLNKEEREIYEAIEPWEKAFLKIVNILAPMRVRSGGKDDGTN